MHNDVHSFFIRFMVKGVSELSSMEEAQSTALATSYPSTYPVLEGDSDEEDLKDDDVISIRPPKKRCC